MSAAIICTSEVCIGASPDTVEVVAKIVEGNLKSGSQLKIELNRSTSVEVPIAQISELGNGQVRLTLNCRDEEFASIIEALNFSDETILVE